MKIVLLVDDEEDILESLKTIIQLEEKTKVYTALNGLMGLEIFKKEKPDIVLTDMKMPVRDGLWLLDEIRKLDESTPVVFLSGFSSVTPSELKTRSYQGFIKKPEDILNVVETINALVDK